MTGYGHGGLTGMGTVPYYVVHPDERLGYKTSGYGLGHGPGTGLGHAGSHSHGGGHGHADGYGHGGFMHTKPQPPADTQMGKLVDAVTDVTDTIKWLCADVKRIGDRVAALEGTSGAGASRASQPAVAPPETAGGAAAAAPPATAAAPEAAAAAVDPPNKPVLFPGPPMIYTVEDEEKGIAKKVSDEDKTTITEAVKEALGPGRAPRFVTGRARRGLCEKTARAHGEYGRVGRRAVRRRRGRCTASPFWSVQQRPGHCSEAV